MAEVLTVEERQSRGKRSARRMRRAGSVPAVLYGHGERNISLTVPSEQVQAAVRHGARVVDLQGAVSEKAFIRELQWDIYGTEVVHLDLTRVSADERVEVEIEVELRGESPGVKQGGIVSQLVHQVEVECPAISIPEKLTLRISNLKLNESLSAGEIGLPAGVKLLTPAETVIVQCTEPKAEEELLAGVGEAAEPEVIGRKAEEEE